MHNARLAIVAAAVLAGVPGAAPAMQPYSPGSPQRVEANSSPAIYVAAVASEAELSARVQAAYALLDAGDGDRGFEMLHAVLLDAARTDLFPFSMKIYAEAGAKLFNVGMTDQAAQVFKEGAQTQAARSGVREAADFYLIYAQFRTQVLDSNEHFVPLYTKAAGLYAELYGSESMEVLNATDYLATALSGIGQYGTAAHLMQGNYDVALRVLGPEDTLTWRFANNLADVLRGMGAPSRALVLDKMVLEKRTRHYGRNHFNVLVSANNTAQDYLDLGDYPNAVSMFELDRDIAVALANDPGLITQADSWILYTRLLAGTAKLDERNVEAMDALITDANYPAILCLKAANLLADHFARVGDDARSMHHLEQAYSIAGGEMTLAHPLAFAARVALANAKARSDTGAAATDFAAIDKEMLATAALQVAYIGDRTIAEATRALADDMLYDYARLAMKDPAVVPDFADAVRRWPSLEDGRRDSLRKAARAIDAGETAMHDLLNEAIRVSLTSQQIFAAGGAELDQGYALLDRAKALTDEINRRLAEVYKLDSSVVDKPLPTPRDLLKPHEAAVQFFITRKWRGDREAVDPFVDTRLYAIVSRKDRDPKLFDLGDPRAIMSGQEETVALASLRSGDGEQTRGAVALAVSPAEASGLYHKLFAPLEAEISDAGTVFIIPDGQLFAVPFSLLRDDTGQLLEQRVTLRLLTRPESLYGVTSDQTLPKGGRAVLAGGLDYSRGSEKGADPLPGTLAEVNAIADILGRSGYRTEMLTGDAASEVVLKKDMEQATIAHLATHGAYRSARAGGASDVDTLWQSDVILSRSGDREAMKRDESDGRLYAFELMTFDLSKLDLLVLSACETGRGEETFVGGLRGLPTAINIAGAKRSLLTLWPVDDTGTQQFMVRFYEHLAAGDTYAGALRQTRLDAINGKLPSAKDPRVWAAFVMFEN